MVCFRCLDERHIPTEVELMRWNPKMDLMMMALRNGDLVLHRLASWQRVWHIPAPKIRSGSGSDQSRKIKVVDLSWRPDGKILAVAYDTNFQKNEDQIDKDDHQSCVVLHDVESSELIHLIPVKGKVSCICWAEKRITNERQTSDDDLNLATNKESLLPFMDLLPKIKGVSSKRFLGEYSSRKINDENINDLMKVENQETLNILAIGTDSGSIELLALGVFKIARIEIEMNHVIKDLALLDDLGVINVLLHKQEGNENKYSIINYELEILRKRSFQILVIAKTYAQSVSLLYYLDGTIKEILEAWEDVMVEIDSKLSNYGAQNKVQKKAEEVKIPLLADELLELLAIGNASDSLEKFLTDLTEKGLKKLGHSIELAYSNIQKLVVKDIQRACQLLFCHINTLRGMSLWESKFGGMGVDASSANIALQSIGSFLLKSTELQQVIDNSMRNVKAFIRWLYASMTRLYNNEPTTQSELNKVSQQDIQFVTEFIKENFGFEQNKLQIEAQRPTENNFTLERVGQYFKDRDLSLTVLTNNEVLTNPWISYLNEHSQLVSSPDNKHVCLYPHHLNNSLIQEYKNCEKSIHDTFLKPFEVISDSITKCHLQNQTIDVTSSEDNRLRHATSMHQSCAHNAFVHSQNQNKLFIVKNQLNETSNPKVAVVCFYGAKNSNYETTQLDVVDLKFYNHDLLSLLLSDNESSISFLVQFPIQIIAGEFKPFTGQFIMKTSDSVTVNLGSCSTDQVINYRSLDNMKSSVLAVSGSRKVACVLFESKRRVRLFEMDVAEDEEAEAHNLSGGQEQASQMEVESSGQQV